MVERLLIALALAAAGAAAFWLFRRLQMRQASAASAAAGKPALLYFRSDTCAPCVTQARFVKQVEGQFGDRIAVEKVDAGLDPAAAERYGVFTLPTVLVVDARGTVRFANYGLTEPNKLAGQLRAVEPQLAG
jgi:thioredoxin 1